MSAGESARDYLATHVTAEQTVEVVAFIKSLPEPEGTLAEVFARAEIEAAQAHFVDGGAV